jgi:predicted RNA-binding protein YlqC (UPF0109 family)
MSENSGEARALIEQIARLLVDEPGQVSVEQVEEDDATVFELTVAERDLGKVIGKQGRTARALRNVLGVVGMKSQKRFVLEIIE